jgi:hypothetical protein
MQYLPLSLSLDKADFASLSDFRNEVKIFKTVDSTAGASFKASPQINSRPLRFKRKSNNPQNFNHNYKKNIQNNHRPIAHAPSPSRVAHNF